MKTGNEDADAKVDVHVKVIPEEAVRRSGSMRISGLTQEEFPRPVALEHLLRSAKRNRFASYRID